jgi:hypothetical protein
MGGAVANVQHSDRVHGMTATRRGAAQERTLRSGDTLQRCERMFPQGLQETPQTAPSFRKMEGAKRKY